MLVHKNDDWPLYIAALAGLVAACLVLAVSIVFQEHFPGEVRIPILALEAASGVVSLLVALVRRSSRHRGH